MYVDGRKHWLGSAVLLLVILTVPALLLIPSVRRPLARTVRTIGTDLLDLGDTGTTFEIAVPAGLRPGHPVFLADRAGSLRPVAHVASVGESSLEIRFAEGEDERGPWRLCALPPAEGLGDAWKIAVPRETAKELERHLGRRVEALLKEAILPELERHLPAFLARVDPRESEAARRVLDAVGAELGARLKPLAGELAGRVVKDLEGHLDLLDRVGLVWRMVRGDGRGIEKRVAPIAEKSARDWWNENQDRVLEEVGRGLAETAPTWQEWIGGEVLRAARDELAEPVFEAQRERFEKEAEDAMSEMLDAIIRAPEGGFRVRFAAVLRSRLLEKDEPLLLLERVP